MRRTAMDKETAIALMREFKALTEPLNRATELGIQLIDQNELEAVLRSIGSIMDIAYVDIMRQLLDNIPSWTQIANGHPNLA